MNIEDILKKEDEQFFKTYEESENKSKKKRTSSSAKNLNSSDPEELRDVVIDILTNPSKENSYLEEFDKKNKFPRQGLTKNLNLLLKKYKFNPDRMAEKEAVAVFIKNLESISKM